MKNKIFLILIFMCIISIFNVSAELTAGNLTNLSQTDSGNWNSLAYTRGVHIYPQLNVTFTLSSLGKLGMYNYTNNTWLNITNLPGNAVGMSCLKNDSIYFGTTQRGSFFRYNITTATFTNLSATDTGGWTNNDYVMTCFPSRDIIYTGLNNSVGYYNESSNIWTNITTNRTQFPGSIATGTSVAVLQEEDYDLVFACAQSTNLTFFNTSSGLWNNTVIAADHTCSSIDANITSDVVYYSRYGSVFQEYNKTSHTITRLDSKDTGNWMGTSTMYSTAVFRDLVFTGSSAGLGLYNKTSDVWSNITIETPWNWYYSLAAGGRIIYCESVGIMPTGELLTFIGIANGSFGVYSSGYVALPFNLSLVSVNFSGNSSVLENSIFQTNISDSGNCQLWTNYSGTWNITSSNMTCDSSNLCNNKFNWSNKYSGSIKWNSFCCNSFYRCDWASSNETSMFNYTGGTSDTCTYSGSGNWEVLGSDNCIINNTVVGNGSDLTITGAGTFTTFANISNFSHTTFIGTNITDKLFVRCKNGGCFR